MRRGKVKITCYKCGHSISGNYDPRRNSEETYIDLLGAAVEKVEGWRRMKRGWLCSCCTGIIGKGDGGPYEIKGIRDSSNRIVDVEVLPKKPKGPK